MGRRPEEGPYTVDSLTSRAYRIGRLVWGVATHQATRPREGRGLDCESYRSCSQVSGVPRRAGPDRATRPVPPEIYLL